MSFKKIFLTTTVFLSAFALATPVSAHVVVKPNEVGVAQRTNFVVSVPTEKNIPTTGLRLLVPEGLQSVRPNVKPGWTIELKKTGEGEDAKITEIIWKGGSIPADQRDEFVFSAQAPSSETSLQWKAYQTYKDGEVVAWDKDPQVVEEYAKNNPTQSEDAKGAPEPFSVTNVVNDLAASSAPKMSADSESKPASNKLMSLGVLAAVGMSAAALSLQLSKRNAS